MHWDNNDVVGVHKELPGFATMKDYELPDHVKELVVKYVKDRPAHRVRKRVNKPRGSRIRVENVD